MLTTRTGLQTRIQMHHMAKCARCDEVLKLTTETRITIIILKISLEMIVMTMLELKITAWGDWEVQSRVKELMTV